MHPVNPTNKNIDLFSTIPQPPFKVINPKNKRLVATVWENKVCILDKGVRENINTSGVIIPAFLREKFQHRKNVFCNEPLFYEAFVTAGCWDLLRSGYRIEKEDEPLFEGAAPTLPTTV